MISDSRTRQQLQTLFPFLADSQQPLRDDFFRHASRIHLPAGQTIAYPGDECAQFILIISGHLRIFRATDNGREITLYRLGTGESCVLTAACIMGRQGFPAEARSTSPIDAVTIPAQQARNWLTSWPAWCTFTFGLVSQRLAEVIAMLEEVAFQRMNVRIAHYLLTLSTSDENPLHITHQQIADDLGTSREVVSRIIKSFEREHLLRASRKTISIIDRQRLLALNQGV